MSKRRKLSVGVGLIVALIASCLIAAGAATAEQPVVVKAGNLELTFNGGFSPKAMSKTKPTPIKLNVSGKIATIDGTHPPALREFILETDKNGGVNVKGYPVCKAGQLQSRDSSSAEKICKSALLGTGTTGVEIAFPEQPPIPVHSKLLVFNGGERGGTITFYIHAYITVPTPAAIVTTVKIKKVHHGRFGIKSVASIPKIAGGSGSVTSFSLAVDKKFTYKGKKVSVLTAKCTDGKLVAQGEAFFSDGTKAEAEVVRTCTPKG
ncbi:MAG TPA: hypothetical protein VFJ65_10480 [Solirubrobacterales bacterium]|nr:hypothetical protein [Solirubrobacterales bacterium]